MKVAIELESFEPWQVLQEYEAGLPESFSIGAVATFVGRMRDFNEGRRVSAMTLEHYPGMTEKILQNIVVENIERYDLADALVVHRVGQVTPAEVLVLVAVWSAHRAAAFDACRMIMENLKSEAPLWKLEQHQSGETRWVTKNTPSDDSQ